MDLRTRCARILLRLTVHADDRECVLADLEEEFESRRTRYGDAAAQRWYRDQVWRSLAPVLVRRWQGGMEQDRHRAQRAAIG